MSTKYQKEIGAVILLVLPEYFLISCVQTPVTQAGGSTVSVTIISPVNNDIVAQIATLAGTAKADAGVSRVAFSIDGGPYSPAVGVSNWYASIYAKLLPVGTHTVTAEATDTKGNKAYSTTTFEVVHSNPICSHSSAGPGIFCEQAGFGSSDVQGKPATVTFSHGYTAGDTVIVVTAANDRRVPYVSTSISNTAGYAWTFLGNVSSTWQDDDLVQNGVYYTVVPVTRTATDTITINKPSASFTAEYTVVYSGLGPRDGGIGHSMGLGGPGKDGTTGDYTVSVGDLCFVEAGGAPTIPGPGWTERLEDPSRPFAMILDKIATSTTCNATWKMNPEGFGGYGIAFKPKQPRDAGHLIHPRNTESGFAHQPSGSWKNSDGRPGTSHEPH